MVFGMRESIGAPMRLPSPPLCRSVDGSYCWKIRRKRGKGRWKAEAGRWNKYDNGKGPPGTVCGARFLFCYSFNLALDTM